MAADGKRKKTIVSLQFDNDSEDGAIALDYLRGFKRKQGRFVTALLLWYINNAEKYNLTYNEKTGQIVDLTHMLEAFERLGVSKEKIIETYGSLNAITEIMPFFNNLNTSNEESIKLLASMKQRKSTKNSSEVAKKENKAIKNGSQDESLFESGEEEDYSNVSQKDALQNQTYNKPDKNESESVMNRFDDSENDEDDDDWMLGMAGSISPK